MKNYAFLFAYIKELLKMEVPVNPEGMSMESVAAKHIEDMYYATLQNDRHLFIEQLVTEMNSDQGDPAVNQAFIKIFLPCFIHFGQPHHGNPFKNQFMADLANRSQEFRTSFAKKYAELNIIQNFTNDALVGANIERMVGHYVNQKSQEVSDLFFDLGLALADHWQENGEPKLRRTNTDKKGLIFEVDFFKKDKRITENLKRMVDNYMDLY